MSNFEKEYQSNEFWHEQGYDLKEIIESNFTTKKGLQLFDNWYSTYLYYKKYFKSVKTILEIGIGSGIHIINFERLGFGVTGIEPAKNACDLVQNKLVNGKCINGFFEDLQLEQKFDMIYMYHTLEHIKNPKNLLEKCKNNLNDNGKIIIVVPDCTSQEKKERSKQNKYHLWYFTRQDLSQLLTNCGFEIIDISSLKHVTKLNYQRLFRILKNNGLEKLRRLFFPYYPFVKTNKLDSFEIRCIAQKQGMVEHDF